MKTLSFSRAAWALLLFASLSVTAAFGQKLTPDELIAKHLESIGTKEKRASVKNQLIVSDLQFTVQGSALPVRGRAVIVSAGDRNLWGMSLTSNDYPQDKFGFDGKNVRAGFTRPGVRSTLGGFILSYKELLREGLLGGTLSSSWSLLDTSIRNPKLSYDGTKKTDGAETHVLSYLPRGGSDLSIKMFFDAKTFRHVRTEYIRVISARQGASIDASAGQRPDYYRLTEEFSEFQNVGGLTIPKKYNLRYSYSGGGGGSLAIAQQGGRELEWAFNVTNFSLNQQLEQNVFDIEGN